MNTPTSDAAHLLNSFIEGPFKSNVLPKQNKPLRGVAIAVKDNIEVAGMPCTGGTKALINYVPSSDAPVVKKLKDAGCEIIGKTNLHELAFGITSNNFLFGPVGNPYDNSRFAGGSSGGSAVAVQKDIVALALGTDTGGSCRIPAALCGILGFRPSVGRYDLRGVIPLSSTRDTIGLLAKDIDLMILADQEVTGETYMPEVSVEQLRLAVPKAYFCEDLDPDIVKGFDQNLAKLRNSGVTLVERDMDGLPNLLKHSLAIVAHETAVLLPKFLEKTGICYEELKTHICSPDVRAIFDEMIGINPDYEKCKEERNQLKALYKSYFDTYEVDGLLYPTTPAYAQKIEGSIHSFMHNGREVPTFATFIRNMNPGSYIGSPGISVPGGTVDIGLPYGLHIESLYGDDRKLLAVAKSIQRLLI